MQAHHHGLRRLQSQTWYFISFLKNDIQSKPLTFTNGYPTARSSYLENIAQAFQYAFIGVVRFYGWNID